MATTPTPSVDLETQIKNILSTGLTDAEGATAKIMALLKEGEASPQMGALKSFIGNLLKSGRGGASLGVLGSMGASMFLGQSWMWYAIAAIAAMAVTAPTSTSFYKLTTKGEPMWLLGLMTAGAALAGGAALWAFDHVNAALVANLLSKL